MTMKEFTVSDAVEPLEFKIGTDIFKALAPERLPGNVVIRYAEQVNQGKIYEAHQTFFARALDKESAELFMHRLDSKENPITLGTMVQVAEWLMEQYSNLITTQP
jgi:hypothetical protein